MRSLVSNLERSSTLMPTILETSYRFCESANEMKMKTQSAHAKCTVSSTNHTLASRRRIEPSSKNLLQPFKEGRTLSALGDFFTKMAGIGVADNVGEDTANIF